VCCVPFSPVPGPRLLAGNDADRTMLVETALELTRELGLSSFHILFPTAPEGSRLFTSSSRPRRTTPYSRRCR